MKNNINGDGMKKYLIILLVILFVSCTNENNKKNKDNEKIDSIKEPKTEILKELTEEDYINNNVNELGEVPIMMYHGIYNLANSDTKYIGGNVDKDGYQRTKEAFINDLEFYYKNGYRMIRLTDYIDGNIDTELGYSPIILTFDDGLENCIKVTGLDENGNIIIDPNSAVGILESFKKKYKDYNVTATFFINGAIFNQEEYNESILNWLVNNGYDVGNHTYTHVDFKKASINETQNEVGKVYELLDKYIEGKYVNIIALPFGSPYSIDNPNMEYIFNTNYNNKNYNTKSALRVGWKASESPFHKEFNPKFLKRIRAYDNNGTDFDIDFNFKLLSKNRYISDGFKDKVVIPKSYESYIGNSYNKKVITY